MQAGCPFVSDSGEIQCLPFPEPLGLSHSVRKCQHCSRAEHITPTSLVLMVMGRKDPDPTAGAELSWAHGGINRALRDFPEFCSLSVVFTGLSMGKLQHYINKQLQTL